jgi:hypothetical protein
MLGGVPLAYVPVPKDLTKIKTKVIFNLTKRQLFCFSLGALAGVPIFFLLRSAVNISVATLIMIVVVNTGETRQQLENDAFQAAGIAQKYNCALVRLDFQQEQGRVSANRAQKRATRYYIDEFHLLLKDEITAAYSAEIWKRFRKWGGIPTAITQNVKDLLNSKQAENIFENSDFILLLNQAPGDRAILAKLLNISPHQLSYVTHSGEGEGLIVYGDTILPFLDHFNKESRLYQMMTTKPGEM